MRSAALLFALAPLCAEAQNIPEEITDSAPISSIVSLSGPFNAQLTASDGSGQIRILTPSKEMTGKTTDCTTTSKIFTLPVGTKIKTTGDMSNLTLKTEPPPPLEKEPTKPKIFQLQKGSVYFHCISRAENQNVTFIVRTRVGVSGVTG